MMRSLLVIGLLMSSTSCGAPSASDFAQRFAMSDMYEVEAGKDAELKGQSPQVKGLVQTMVEAP